MFAAEGTLETHVESAVLGVNGVHRGYDFFQSALTLNQVGLMIEEEEEEEEEEEAQRVKWYKINRVHTDKG